MSAISSSRSAAAWFMFSLAVSLQDRHRAVPSKIVTAWCSSWWSPRHQEHQPRGAGTDVGLVTVSPYVASRRGRAVTETRRAAGPADPRLTGRRRAEHRPWPRPCREETRRAPIPRCCRHLGTGALATHQGGLLLLAAGALDRLHDVRLRVALRRLDRREAPGARVAADLRHAPHPPPDPGNYPTQFHTRRVGKRLPHVQSRASPGGRLPPHAPQ